MSTLPDYGKYDRNQMRKMTHLEYFKLTDTYILFDYQNRNPLNQEARVCKIEKKKLLKGRKTQVLRSPKCEDCFLQKYCKEYKM